MNSWEAWKNSVVLKTKILHLINEYNMPILTIADACHVNEKVIRDSVKFGKKYNSKFTSKNIALIQKGIKEIYMFIGEEDDEERN